MTQQYGFEQVTEFLYGDAPTITGWSGTEDEAVLEASRLYPGRSYCLVRDWMLVDILTSPEVAEAISNQGFSTRLIFSHRIVLDSAERFLPGYWVRSTWQKSYHESGFFESRNTIYILLGEGKKKTAEYWVLASIY
ncbi:MULTISPECIES: DUF6957 family protein [Pseudomonas]|uniref:DUF6957 family protein n=1 Tax=Pseudomonas TaxID=286 RepID=UPI0030023E47